MMISVIIWYFHTFRDKGDLVGFLMRRHEALKKIIKPNGVTSSNFFNISCLNNEASRETKLSFWMCFHITKS